MGWTEERVEQLKTLWTEGLSASQIARVHGRGHPQCRDRQGASAGPGGPRRTSTRAERPRIRCRASTSRARSPEPEIVEEDPITLEDGNFATVLTINDRMCRWPIGDPAENEFHFCGRKPKDGSPYCEAHARKAYQPQSARRDRRADGRVSDDVHPPLEGAVKRGCSKRAPRN